MAKTKAILAAAEAEYGIDSKYLGFLQDMLDVEDFAFPRWDGVSVDEDGMCDCVW